MKTLLIIAGGVESAEGIKMVKKMGFKVIVSDGNPDAPGFLYADEKIIASTYDERKTSREAIKINKKNRIDGVITIGSDVPYTVAYVANKLGLNGYSERIAKLCSDKLALKKHLAKANIPLPWFQEIKSLNMLREVVRKKGYPLVIKPVDNRGARGVMRITPETSLRWAYKYSLSHSPKKKIILEDWLSGPQISTESIVWDERIVTLGSADRNYEFLERFKPHVIENGGEIPSSLNHQEWPLVEKLLAQAIRALGSYRGTIKADIVVTKDGPKIIELAPRLSGGYFCTHTIPLATGVNVLQAACDIALRREPQWERLVTQHKQYLVQRFFFPQSGRIKKIEGLKEAQSLPGIKLLKIYAKEGWPINNPTCHSERAGVVITAAATPTLAVKRAQEVIKMVKFCTE